PSPRRRETRERCWWIYTWGRVNWLRIQNTSAMMAFTPPLSARDASLRCFSWPSRRAVYDRTRLHRDGIHHLQPLVGRPGRTTGRRRGPDLPCAVPARLALAAPGAHRPAQRSATAAAQRAYHRRIDAGDHV